MIFNIVNFSDPYTLVADDLEIAAVAVCFLGEGVYGLKEIGCAAEVPMFPFAGHDEWFMETFGRTFEESVAKVMNEKPLDLAKVFELVLIGNETDRTHYESTAAKIDNEESRRVYAKEYHEHRRSSENDIGARSVWLAHQIKEKAASTRTSH